MALAGMIDHSFLKRLSSVARHALEQVPPSRAVDVENKGDGFFDPVTSADRAIELTLRDCIARHFPDDALVGEELGGVRSGAARCWSIDPIDGTRAFICGLPSWSILVGVVEGGAHIAGMVDLPATSELFVAVDGETRCNGVAVRTSGETDLARARLSTTDPFLFEGDEFIAFDRVRRAVLLTRYGLDGSAYARLAAGDLDLVIESGLKLHDYDALIPVVRGAGGHIGDWEGGGDFGAGRIVAAASRELYGKTVQLMKTSD
jgi:inositol-phosphate phosphatase/L-galactose 1-phosphate phosphatase/histidinol-phosphatase